MSERMNEGNEGRGCGRKRKNERVVRDLRLWKSEEGRDVRELECKSHDGEEM